jgi:hypothetical protein
LVLRISYLFQIELDLEVTRNDIEEHAKAGYTTPYQCWCSAYGGHQEIISRRASILFSCKLNNKLILNQVLLQRDYHIYRIVQFPNC